MCNIIRVCVRRGVGAILSNSIHTHAFCASSCNFPSMMLIFRFFLNSYNSLSSFSFIFSLQDEEAYDVLQRGPAKQSQVTAEEVCIY